MCGIVYSKDFRNKAVNQRVIQQFYKQKNRGKEGFGLFDRDYGNIIKATGEAKILKWLRTKPSTEVMFHHRYPTSTKNVKNAAHPFSTRDYFDTNYILVHNGVIMNSEEVKKGHDALGIEYTSMQPNGDFNDSEALAWDIALYLEGKQEGIKCKGTIAFICTAKNKNGDKLYFGRNTNPLNMIYTKKGLHLASEGGGVPIKADTLYTFDYTKKTMTENYLVIPRNFVYTTPATPVAQGHRQGFTRNANNDYWGFNTDQYDEEEIEILRTEFGGDEEAADKVDMPESLKDTALAYSENPETQERDIKNRFNEYIKRAEGRITTAFNMVGKDLEWLEKASDDYLTENEEVDTDLEYEIKIQKAVHKCIYSDPFWDNAESIHPSWKPANPIKGADKIQPTIIGTTIPSKLTEASTFATNSVQAIIQTKLLERSAK